jgi:hypothetical protein
VTPTTRLPKTSLAAFADPRPTDREHKAPANTYWLPADTWLDAMPLIAACEGYQSRICPIDARKITSHGATWRGG